MWVVRLGSVLILGIVGYLLWTRYRWEILTGLMLAACAITLLGMITANLRGPRR